MIFCSKKTYGITLTTQLNMVFNFQPFVKNVLEVILRELITGNVYGLIKKLQLSFYVFSSCCLLGLSVALGREFL